MGPGGLSTGDSGEGVEPGELRDSAGLAFSRVEVAVDAATGMVGPVGLSTGGSRDSEEGVEFGELRDSAGLAFSKVEVAVVVSVFILFVFLFVPRAFVYFARSGFFFVSPSTHHERSEILKL